MINTEYIDSSGVESLLAQYDTNFVLTHESINSISSLISLIFRATQDLEGALSLQGIPVKLDYKEYEITFKNNVLEVFTGLFQGIPMIRSQRTIIETLARLCLILQFNTLLSQGHRRNEPEVGTLEGAVTTRKVKTLTSKFSNQLKAIGCSEVAEYFDSLYTKLNGTTHGNPSTRYPEYFDDFLSRLHKQSDQSLIQFQAELENCLFCIIFYAQKFINTRVLSRSDFAWLSKHSSISESSLSIIA
ncbi:hypothetical protein [Lacticaseibacillus suibinensis]|uniref:hypothetical protein n=1 Tax=Lacticaseibacillus suibinensis TaxID=2486011 RepID=UPI000F7B40AB|nr:hypothetical protein [Lacticaseibacillus suibinensis]